MGGHKVYLKDATGNWTTGAEAEREEEKQETRTESSDFECWDYDRKS